MVCVCIKYNPYLKGALFRKYLGCMYLYTFGAADTLALGAVKVAAFFGSSSLLCPLGRAGGAGAERGEVKAQSTAGRQGAGAHVTPCLAYRCLNVLGGKNNRPTKQTKKKNQQIKPVWMRLHVKF